MKKTNSSIVVSFYNKIELLKIILHSLNNQFDGTFNVIIADDGSNSDVVSEINNIKCDFDFELIHLWQENLGFRKNKILNQAVSIANDYVIFIDGDCIPQEHFVIDHLSNAKNGYCLNGRRANLSASVSKKISITHPEIFFKKHIIEILFEYFLGRGKNIEKGFRFTNKSLSSFLNRKNKGIVGCNFSLFKEDMIKINGFDERYEAPGIGEDSDIEFRLRLNGVKIKNIFFMANQVHIFHQELPRSSKNDRIFKSVLASNCAYTAYGIVQTEHEN